jgi:hypothetical protein
MSAAPILTVIVVANGLISSNRAGSPAPFPFNSNPGSPCVRRWQFEDAVQPFRGHFLRDRVQFAVTFAQPTNEMRRCRKGVATTFRFLGHLWGNSSAQFRASGGLGQSNGGVNTSGPVANSSCHFAQTSYRAFDWSLRARNCRGRLDLPQFRALIGRGG